MNALPFDVRPLRPDDLHPYLLTLFQHRQQITRKWVRAGEKWVLTDANDLRAWSDEKRRWIPEYLLSQTERGGFAVGAFHEGRLIGFSCVDGPLMGGCAAYANLTMLFVDDRYKRMGVGRALFREICRHAAEGRAERLFISAIPSAETISFYLSMGCSDAEEIIADFVDTESDRYLQYLL